MNGKRKYLIDADKFEKFVHKHRAAYMFKEDILAAIANQPTVDAVEVVHGWWIELPGMEPDYKCSECGQSYAWWEPSEAHYCPHCGAKMDGDGNGS